MLGYVGELRNKYLEVMEEISEVAAWEFTWDYSESGTDIPTEGPTSIYIPDTIESKEQLFNLVMADGVRVTDNPDEFIVEVAVGNKELAFEIAKKLYASFGFKELPQFYKGKEGEEMPAILDL